MAAYDNLDNVMAENLWNSGPEIDKVDNSGVGTVRDHHIEGFTDYNPYDPYFLQGPELSPNPDPDNPFMKNIDGSWINTKGWNTQTWPVPMPEHDTRGWGGDMDINQIREKIYPDMPPPQDYTMGQQLMHLFNQKMFPETGHFKNWWAQKGPKLTKTSKGFLPDGSPAYSPEGQQITREQTQRLQWPGRYDYDEYGNVRARIESPIVPTGDEFYPHGKTPHRRVEHADTYEPVE